jgi:hypothetical protein
MQKSSVKMMSTISEIENHILKGLVLDEHGQWIPIADKKTVEEDFLAHLSAGKVLHEGRWVTIGEAKSAKAPTEFAIPVLDLPPSESREEGLAGPPPAPDSQAENPVEETRSGQPEPQPVPSGRVNPEFPPETKTILYDQPVDRVSGQEVAAQVDPLSGYAPETGAFMVEQVDDNQPGLEPEGEPANRSTTSILLPTVSSWEQSAKKSRLRILVFGGIGVALAGIGAILILIFQLAR